MIRKTLASLGQVLSTDTNARIDRTQAEITALRQHLDTAPRGYSQPLPDISPGLHDLKMLAGTQAAIAVSALENLPYLGAAGFRVFSQWGEDGIIEWLVSKLPMLRQSFVEFGVEQYTEANTPFLLQHRNWRGLIADISKESMDGVRGSDLMWRHDLRVAHMQITRANIDSLFTDHGFAGEIGILSIDIDGNDYWVWEAIAVSNPGIIICEYNGLFGDVHPISVPPDDNFYRTDKHFSNLYWGMSIKAAIHLADSRGYTLIGSNTEGCNAFFVRNDLAPLVANRVADRRPRPPLFRESRDAQGALTYLSGAARLDAIASMPVVDVVTGQQGPISAYRDTIYSEHWSELMGS